MNNRNLTALYFDTLNEIVTSENEWMDFLDCAAMNYNHSFNNQVLIYAQRPDAIICNTLDDWNKHTGRWVKKNSKGIAVVEEIGGIVSRKYLFGLEDTNHFYNEKYHIWSINKQYEKDVIKELNYYNADNIIEVIKADIDNMLIDTDSQLKEDLIRNSVSYMVLKRSGFNPRETFSSNDFKGLNEIINMDEAVKIGLEIKDLSTTKITEIRNIVKKVRKREISKIRTFEKDEPINYNGGENERSDSNVEIQSDRRLSNTRSSIAEREQAISSGREIRNDEVRVSETREESTIHRVIDEERTITTPNGNSELIRNESGNNNETTYETRENNRETQSDRPNEMGWNDEQLEEDSRRNSNERTNLQLDHYIEWENKPPYVVVDEKINQILAITPHLKISNSDIVNYFENEKSTDKRVDFLKQSINNDYSGVIVDNEMYGYKKYEEGMEFWKGNYLTMDHHSFVKWEDLIDHYEAMILLNQLKDRPEKLPSEKEQISLIENELTEKENEVNDLEFTQEFIDRYLQEEHTETKYGIYEQFQKSLSSKENADYLKDFYGLRGSSYTIKGSGIGYWADSKGIKFNRGYLEESAREEIFSWNYIAKRIKELIKEDRYLNSKEMKNYSDWLEKREQREYELETELDNPEDITEEIEYEYHLGDKVYIGANEYEILDIGDEIVTLYDFEAPLFNEEMSYEEFDRKVKENPCNDHLIKNAEEKVDTTIEKEDLIGSNVLETKEEKYYGEYNNEIDLINHILKNHKINDIRMEFNDDEVIIARDDDGNEWQGNDFYDFLFNELFDYNEDGKVDLINDEDFKMLEEYRSKYTSEEKDIEEEVEKEELTEKVEAELVPAFEKPKRTKINSFNIHPEIKMEDRIQYVITDDNLGVGTHDERVKNNIEAITVLKQCEEENRFATPEEQEILAQYVGWGGLSDVFEEDNKYYDRIKDLLDSDEYQDARTSSLTAFYTPPKIIRSMYKALENMGLKNGNLLEPSCGIGHFIGMLPESLSESKIYGIELDSISGRIARQLYQKNSIAVKGYENTPLPNSFFDVAIGNIPFSDIPVVDKKYDKYNFSIHDYFFAKTLDKVRPGGIIAFITSKQTMDKKSPTARKYIAQRADLIGAIRLPNDVFKGNAGTKVTTDILILQKRDSLTDIVPDWVNLDTDYNGMTMNSYFVENPEMIMGTMKMTPTQYGPRPECIADENQDLEERLNNAFSRLDIKYEDYEIDDEFEEDLSIEADINVKNFSYTLVDGEIYFRENSRMYPQGLNSATKERVKALMEIRDCTRQLIEYQLEDYPNDDIVNERNRLNELYDNFTKKYGLISSKANATVFSNDSSYYLLCSLEILDDKGKLLRKADMFNKRTIKAKKSVDKVDSASDALAVSLSEKAKVDISYMQQLCGLDIDKMLNDLEEEIFNVPEYGEVNNWVTADEYLSGNVREKLKTAEAFAQEDERYKINVEYLKKVMPKDLSAGDISVRLGSTWLPTEIVKEFIDDLLEPSWYVSSKVKVHYMPQTAEWNIEGKSEDKTNVKAYSTYGTGRANAYKIIEDTLNLRDTRIYNYYEDSSGKKVQELDRKQTAIAQAKQESIKMAFNEWIWKDPDRRNRLVKIYNERFNSIKPRDYDGSHIKFDGINPEITLRPHQMNAVARILYGGNTLLAHEVGAGKTFTMVAAAMEGKRLGLCNKSLFVVPNHIVEQFGHEFLQLYPSANILVTTKKDFKAENRKKFCSRIATGDYDAIIISHSQFEKIPMSIKQQILSIQEQINDITVGIKEMKWNNGEKFSIKQMEKTKKKLEAKLEKLNNTDRKDDVITFEELGVDRLFVDEAHYFKNLYLYTKMRNVGGIAQTEAQKSSDLYMKCRYLDKITDGKGIIFATGTPVSNSMAELYTMQRYLQYDELRKRHLEHFDAWASTFGETVTAIELAPEGTGYRSKTRFAKFFNMPELMAMFREVADIQTEEMIKLPLPKPKYHNIVVKPTDMQKELVESLAERADDVRNKQVERHEDNMLKITNDGRKLALDQRLFNPMLDDDENSKISVCANNVYDIWEKNSDKKSSQLIFCDLSTPKKDGTFSVYNDIKKKLVEKGIPEEEIAFIHDYEQDSKKQKLFNQVRKGQVRVLMGSTQKMGAGTNCQDKLLALHDLDCPWRPSDLKQRSGRIIRQGNENEEVNIYRYVTEQTFDAYLYQLVESKQKFISQVFTSKTPVRTMEDVDEAVLSYAEIKALASGNPLILEKTELDADVAKLKLLKQTYLNQKYDIEDKVVKYYPQEIKKLETRLDNIKLDIEHLKNNTKDGVAFQGMIMQGVTYDEKAMAGENIIKICKSMKKKEPKEIGEYRGFKMSISFDTMDRKFHLSLKNNLTYDVELGSDIHGNITRIDNVLNSIEKRLENTKTLLEDTRKQYENAKKEIEIPFSREEELKSKMDRLNELNVQLDIDGVFKKPKQKCNYEFAR